MTFIVFVHGRGTCFYQSDSHAKLKVFFSVAVFGLMFETKTVSISK